MESMKFPTNLLLFFLLLIVTLLAHHIQALNHPNIYNYSSKLAHRNPTVIDPYAFLHIIPNPDGSITRIKEFYPTVPPNTSYSLAFSRDVPLNPDKKTWVRVYLPNKPGSEPVNNLPVVVFAHGGEFILLSTASPQFDLFLSNTANHLRVLVVSVEYRLAPEHRLPAAYDDVLEALYWVKDKKDEWVAKYGDVSRCIIMGESAGGNIAYNVGLQASSLVHQLKPLVIKGLVLIQPFFGGAGRNFHKTVNFPLEVTDLLWKLTLPIGANKNNPYFNPMFGGGSGNLDVIKYLGWRVAIAGCDGDELFNRQLEVFEFLKNRGVNTDGFFFNGFYHGVFMNDIIASQKLFEFVRSVFSSELAY